MSKKITDVKIEVDGKEVKKSSKNYVKVKSSKVTVSWKEMEVYFHPLDYKSEEEIKDLKLGENTLSFHYLGKVDSDSDSDQEHGSNEDIDVKIKVVFNNEEDFKILQKVFKKKE